jgi:hypothetical protein
MGFVCEHCEKFAVGTPCRVLSQEGDEILLDMIVCRSCCEQAKHLGLRVQHIKEKEDQITKRVKTFRSRE